MMSCVEDEWHIFFVCPLYGRYRRALPFTARQVPVEGHEVQCDGCTLRNLTALVCAILQASNFDSVVAYLIRALKSRRQHRGRAFRA